MRLFFLTLCLVVFGQTAYANLFDECTQAIKKGDHAKAEEIAAKLLTFNSISKEYRAEGSACLTYAMGKEYVYSLSLNTFATKDEVAATFEAARKDSLAKVAADKKREDQVDEAARSAALSIQAAAEAKQTQTNEVWKRVNDACTELYADAPNSTVTNQICLNIFLETGLPVN